MNRFIQKLLALPFKATLVHRYPLSKETSHNSLNLTTAESWNHLRTQPGHFFIPGSREHWELMCQHDKSHDSSTGDLTRRAYDLLNLLTLYSFTGEIHSAGAGLGALEFHLKKIAPHLNLTCSDYSAETCARLRTVFSECRNIIQIDLASEESLLQLRNLPANSLLLLHRVDPHLTNKQWVETFGALRKHKIKNVLFVPHVCMDAKYAISCITRQLKHKLKGGKLAVSGYVRTEKCICSLFSASYSLIATPRLGNARGFLLQIRSCTL